MPSLISLAFPRVQIFDKTQRGEGRAVASGCLVKFFYKQICRNSRTSNSVNMKLEPVTKLGKENATATRKTDKGVLL